MCVIVYKPQNVSLDKKVLSKCYDHNPDGAGFAYRSESGFTVHKGYFSFQEFWKDVRQFHTVQLGMHFRIETSGGVKSALCHPFGIAQDPDWAVVEGEHRSILFHNGIISQLGDKDKMSDTLEFATILAYLPPEKRLRALQALAHSSSSVFLFGNGDDMKWHFFGTWSEKYGCKFSNLNWESPCRFYGYYSNDNNDDLKGYYDYRTGKYNSTAKQTPLLSSATTTGRTDLTGKPEEYSWEEWTALEEDEREEIRQFYADYLNADLQKRKEALEEFERKVLESEA